MSNAELISRLSQLTDNPTEVIYSITMQTIIAEIVKRMGIKALALSAEDLQLAAEEVKIAIENSSDYRELVSEGLDAWEVIKEL